MHVLGFVNWRLLRLETWPTLTFFFVETLEPPSLVKKLPPSPEIDILAVLDELGNKLEPFFPNTKTQLDNTTTNYIAQPVRSFETEFAQLEVMFDTLCVSASKQQQTTSSEQNDARIPAPPPPPPMPSGGPPPPPLPTGGVQPPPPPPIKQKVLTLLPEITWLAHRTRSARYISVLRALLRAQGG